jgi:phospholipid/cholesterol/gamma-HCH transport system ATP-binding protein
MAVEMADTTPPIVVQDLTMAYGSYVLQQNLTFSVNKGDIFIVMGGSGCGKSTLLRHLIGLKAPAAGKVYYAAESLWDASPDRQRAILRKTGVLFQKGALWSSMTLAENIALPLQEYTGLPPDTIREVASLKLALVGLAGFEDYYPSEISGGMQKRAGLARAMALDPEILFFDEPSAGLDPISSKLLDDLIRAARQPGRHDRRRHARAREHLRHRQQLDLPRCAKQNYDRTGDPKKLLAETDNPTVQQFLTRGERGKSAAAPGGETGAHASSSGPDR